MRTLASIIASAAVVFCLGTQARADLLNGTFDSTSPLQYWTINNAAITALGYSTPNALDLVANYNGSRPPFTSTGSAFNTFSTVVNQNYDLSFYFKPVFVSGSNTAITPFTFYYGANGSTTTKTIISSISQSGVTALGTGWYQYVLSTPWTASSASSWIDFTQSITGNSNSHPQNKSVILDNVKVTAHQASPVPIPGAVWLLGSGLLGLIGMRRRKS